MSDQEAKDLVSRPMLSLAEWRMLLTLETSVPNGCEMALACAPKVVHWNRKVECWSWKCRARRPWI